jgi:hypothetical protein
MADNSEEMLKSVIEAARRPTDGGGRAAVLLQWILGLVDRLRLVLAMRRPLDMRAG